MPTRLAQLVERHVSYEHSVRQDLDEDFDSKVIRVIHEEN